MATGKPLTSLLEPRGTGPVSRIAAGVQGMLEKTFLNKEWDIYSDRAREGPEKISLSGLEVSTIEKRKWRGMNRMFICLGKRFMDKSSLECQTSLRAIPI